jgi:outer membrane protein insertion porin family
MIRSMSIKAKYLFSIISAIIFIISITVTYNILSSEPSRYEGKIVKKIEFSGLKNVDEDDLTEIMLTSVKYPLKAAEVREDIKQIFALGKFENVKVEIDDFADGVKLRFILVERPVVEKIEFKGHEKILETDLHEAMKIKEGDVYRKILLNESVAAIKAKYIKEGYFNAYITYNVKDGKEKNTVKIEMIIDEGEEIKVKKISILGATKIYVKDLYSLIETKEDTIFQSGSFKKEVFEEDKRKIIGYYQQEGYLDAQIVDEKADYQWSDPTDPNERSIFIVLKLSEGDRYYCDGEYTLEIEDGKSKALTDQEIQKLKDSFLLREKGEIFDNTKFLNDRQSISFLYASKGYIFARVIPNKTITEREVEIDGVKVKRKFVKVNFKISEGKKAYIEHIIIKGNKKTKDKVIRRELVVKEGELFNSEKMQISREKIFNLGYFKQVNFDVRPGSRDDYMNLIIDVEEQPSGTISLGGGYGSASGFSIFSDIQEKNFLGNGQIVGLKLEYGPKKTSVTLSFQERWLFDYPISFNTSVFYYIYQYSTSSIFADSDEYAYYKKRSIGYSLGLGYRFWYYWVAGTTWVHSFKSYFDPSGNSPDTVFINVDRGQQEKRTVKMYLYRDSKDNYLNPTKGFRVGLSAAFTGGAALRGDDHFTQYSLEFYAYYSPFNIPFLKTHPTVIELRASADFIRPPLGKSWVRNNVSTDNENWLESEDRLDIGGPETVRGWDYSDSSLPKSWEYVGLYHRILYGAEYRVPIHPQMLWLVLFFDAGSLWSDKFWEEQLSEKNQKYVNDDLASGKLRRIDQITDGDLLPYFIYSYGFGLKVQVPMMPLRFWFGKKMIYDTEFRTISGYNFQFSIGDIRF